MINYNDIEKDIIGHLIYNNLNSSTRFSLFKSYLLYLNQFFHLLSRPTPDFD